MEIYVDADACPVKAEVLRVAERHGIRVNLVGNSWMRLGDHPLVRQTVVPQGADAADDWIAERIAAGDLVVTADIPLAARCLAAGAGALGPDGRAFTADNIGMAVATRDLKAQLRDSGEITGGPPAFTKKDRSRFLDALEAAVRAASRGR